VLDASVVDASVVDALVLVSSVLILSVLVLSVLDSLISVTCKSPAICFEIAAGPRGTVEG
jgi:hypothetical protein